MPDDRFVDPSRWEAHDPKMEARVAVLEQIAKDTREALVRIEKRVDDGFKEGRSDFRWLLGLLLGLGGMTLSGFAACFTVLVKGFHGIP